MTKRFALLAVLSVIIFASCKKDNNKTPVCDGSNPTYNADIRSIINSNCTSSGCHDAGSGDGDFTSYNGLEAVLNNGRFESEVLKNQTMPEGTSLSESQLNKLQCWADNGFPEN